MPRAASTPGLPSGDRRRMAVLCRGFLVACLAVAVPAPAETPALPEYEVKAAMLYNFAKFVEWPAGSLSEGSFVLGVYGQDPFGPVLDTALKDKTIAGRPVLVDRMPRRRPPEMCQLLFIASSEKDRFREVLASVRQPGVLTVSDIEGFALSGGVIGLVLAGNHIRFEVNRAAARAAGLNISSRLLRLAILVGNDGRRDN